MQYINQLIEELASNDERTRRHAGDALINQIDEAIPALILALRNPNARIRQSAAFLLGKSATPQVAAGLCYALRDEDPKVRKNAAIALGFVGTSEQSENLAQALHNETIAWVRPSLILAFGRVGGPGAHAALAAIEPTSDEEREALRKALDRTAPARPPAQWIGQWRPAALLEAPPGLESLVIGEMIELGLPRPRQVAAGRLLLQRDHAPDDLNARLRCAYGVLLWAADGPFMPLGDPEGTARVVRDLIESSSTIRRWRDWVQTSDETLRFRFAFGPHTRAEVVRAALAAAQTAARPFGLIDSPSRYDCELFVDMDADGSRLYLRPSFSPDQRFDYRLRDVPAALDPVVAAGLARLARLRRSSTVLDPTCGSATLLIERAKLGGALALHGIDNNAEACAAARTNLEAAGIEATIHEADALLPKRWPSCDEVIANLPFGLRTQRDLPNPERFYTAIAQNIEYALTPGGRAVIYTARADDLDYALNQTKLIPGERLKIFAGNMWVNAIVAQKN
ncbi:MAG: hypothetical protein Fur005_36950 [Roseiflexaceae bacterium]